MPSEGLLEESASVAVKRVIAWKGAEAMKAAKVSKSDSAKRMNTSRLQLDRVLDEADIGLTLDTLSRAAAALVLDSPSPEAISASRRSNCERLTQGPCMASS